MRAALVIVIAISAGLVFFFHKPKEDTWTLTTPKGWSEPSAIQRGSIEDIEKKADAAAQIADVVNMGMSPALTQNPAPRPATPANPLMASLKAKWKAATVLGNKALRYASQQPVRRAAASRRSHHKVAKSRTHSRHIVAVR